MARLRPQVATSLVDRVTEEIKASILLGALQPGQQFSIGELCAELDVSHIPVREALRRLEADGLVILRPSRSAIVTPLTLDELAEVYRLRLAIEPTLAASSAPSYTDEALEEAERLCAELRVPDGASRGRAGGEAHARLHELLLSPAAGPLSKRILRRLWDVSERYISWVYDVWPLEDDEPYRLHLELIKIAQLRKGPKMRKAIVDHLTESQAYMREHMTELLTTNGDADGPLSRLPRDDEHLKLDDEKLAAVRAVRQSAAGV
jgi:DNA-binding GntR family transcriptional regulator